MAGRYGNSFLLGDGGYASTRHMLTPLSAPNTEPEKLYQRTHILMRNAVERLFGVWKRRFPSLATGLQIKVETVLIVIVACGVLHNLAIQNSDRGDDFEELFHEVELGNVTAPIVVSIFFLLGFSTFPMC